MSHDMMCSTPVRSPHITQVQYLPELISLIFLLLACKKSLTLTLLLFQTAFALHNCSCSTQRLSLYMIAFALSLAHLQAVPDTTACVNLGGKAATSANTAPCGYDVSHVFQVKAIAATSKGLHPTWQSPSNAPITIVADSTAGKNAELVSPEAGGRGPRLKRSSCAQALSGEI
eukprot:1155240-Pelagomonas_calceolata.AAC.3